MVRFLIAATAALFLGGCFGDGYSRPGFAYFGYDYSRYDHGNDSCSRGYYRPYPGSNCVSISSPRGLDAYPRAYSWGYSRQYVPAPQRNTQSDTWYPRNDHTRGTRPTDWYERRTDNWFGNGSGTSSGGYRETERRVERHGSTETRTVYRREERRGRRERRHD